MGLIIKKSVKGLNPLNCEKRKYFIIKEIIKNNKISKRTQKEYNDYTLKLESFEDDSMGEKSEINFLFERDFNDLITAFGEDTKNWIDRKITVFAINEEFEFPKWNLFPFEFTEEKI